MPNEPTANRVWCNNARLMTTVSWQPGSYILVKHNPVRRISAGVSLPPSRHLQGCKVILVTSSGMLYMLFLVSMPLYSPSSPPVPNPLSLPASHGWFSCALRKNFGRRTAPAKRLPVGTPRRSLTGTEMKAMIRTGRGATRRPGKRERASVDLTSPSRATKGTVRRAVVVAPVASAELVAVEAVAGKGMV